MPVVEEGGLHQGDQGARATGAERAHRLVRHRARAEGALEVEPRRARSANFILLTDGDQTAGGTEAKAIDKARLAKLGDATVVTIGMGLDAVSQTEKLANQMTLQTIASEPSQVYYRPTSNIDEAITDMEAMINAACVEVHYVCR